jgi:hypothetical protein
MADLCFGDLEQDEVIGDICHQMAKSDREHQVGVAIVALLSCVLWAFLRLSSPPTHLHRIRHVIYLFNPLRPPTAVLFPSPYINSQVPFNATFACLHLFLQGYLCVSVFYPPIDRGIRTHLFSVWSNARTLAEYTPPIDPRLFPLFASSIAPILCIVLRKGWAEFTWWCFSGVLFSIHLLLRTGRLHDEARMEELEKLKYHAKGA